jgi:hypothetical protein
MTRAAKFAVAAILFLIVSSIAAKLAWDDYQFSRAQEHVPALLELMDLIGQPPGSTRIPSLYEGPSVNEYAVAVWHYYKTDQQCEYVEGHYESRALERGFVLNSTSRVPSGKRTIYIRGELEFILIANQRDSEVCEVAVSVNWYGAER